MSRDRDLGPPGPEDDGGRPPPGRSAHAEQVVATTSHQALTRTDSRLHGKAQARRCSRETWPWWRRRRAAQRLVALDCGCPTGPHSDPLSCQCTRPPLSQNMIDAGRDAARHVLAAGQIPLLEIEILRALYRRGGDDRQLAQQLYELAGGESA